MAKGNNSHKKEMKKLSTLLVSLMILTVAIPAMAATPEKTAKKPMPVIKQVIAKKTVVKKVVKPAQKPLIKAVIVKKTEKSAVKEFSMTAKNWEFSPTIISVNKGDKVKISITSTDIEHGFNLKEFGINVALEPGVAQVVEFTADKVGTFQFRCSVPCGQGHRDMKGTIVVK